MVAATSSGPITGGSKGRPFGGSVVDLAAHGYLEEEYFIDGEAAAYALAPGAALREDGRWDIVEDRRAEYRSRLLVRRPADPARCNGTVYVEWQNVSGGLDIDAAWMHNCEELLRSGFVWVGVSAQRAGVLGPPLIPGLSCPLTEWDAERYATCSIPDDAFSYDIFTQAARAVGPRRDKSTVDPVGGLVVEKVLAAGQSQSAGRLATYVNAVQPRERAFDAFFIAARGAWVAPLGAGMITREPSRIRDDVDTIVFRVNTEGEAFGSYPVRQPDADVYRYWEIAGSAHQGAYVTFGVDGLLARDLGLPGRAGALPDNDLPSQRAMNAALWHLDRWVRGEGEPPEQPLIEMSGSPVDIVRDAFGNAQGGVRLPELAVPTKQYGPFGLPTVSHRLRGFAVPFDGATLRALYPSHDDYVAKFGAATDAAVDAGALLDHDAEVGFHAARAADVPPEG
jgi:Alpha/beta hydrolase domain